MLSTKEVTITLPGLGKITLIPNDVEQKAAWELYVEYSTRITAQEFNNQHSTLSSVHASLRTLCGITRDVLRSAGPKVAYGEKSLGSIAVVLVNELTRYLSNWAFRLKEHLCKNSSEDVDLSVEKNWEHYSQAVEELKKLQSNIKVYIEALAKLSGVVV